MIPPRSAVVIDEGAHAVTWVVDDQFWQSRMARLARLRMAKRRRRPIWRRGQTGNQPRNAIVMPWGYNA